MAFYLAHEGMINLGCILFLAFSVVVNLMRRGARKHRAEHPRPPKTPRRTRLLSPDCHHGPAFVCSSCLGNLLRRRR